jgi:hypothetical protein
MTLRPVPGSARRGIALDYEIAQEQASALGRLGRALEAALAALAAHDGVAAYDRDCPGQGGIRGDNHDGIPGNTVRPGGDHPADEVATERRKRRAALVQEASHALWCFMVQRECCGLRDPRPVLRDYRVPAEVQNRMGISVTSAPLGPRRRKTP